VIPRGLSVSAFLTSLALAAGQDAMAWRYFTVLDWQIRVRRLAVSKEMEWKQFAQEKALEELLVPPSKPLAPWLSDPSLLPKKPPGRR